jgi:hypothetical protein
MLRHVTEEESKNIFWHVLQNKADRQGFAADQHLAFGSFCVPEQPTNCLR